MSIRRMAFKPQQQLGMAAITITFIMMIIITLIVVGFASIIRRDQQQALDHHLSSRAFYASESGINIAANALKAEPHRYDTTAKDYCGPDTGVGSKITNSDLTLDSGSQTEVSCLLVNTAQPLLLYSVTQGKGQVVPINVTPPATIGSIDFLWQSTSANGATNYGPCNGVTGGGNNLLPNNGVAWSCPGPLLRIDLVPVSGAMSRAGLASQTFTGFFSPRQNGGIATRAYGTGVGNNQGILMQANCSNSPPATQKYQCNVRITGLGGSSYRARVMTYYWDSLLAVDARDSSGVIQNIVGAQATIDSTGRSEDVVRRIQVRLPLDGDNYTPDYAIGAADGICKQYAITPGGTPQVGYGVANTPATFAGATPCD